MIVLVSFASSNMEAALNRLGQQAKDFGVFDKIFLYTERDFPSDYHAIYGDFYKNNPRGFGYWLWKPYFITKTLELLCDNDIIVYLDAGFEINPLGKRRFDRYISTLRKELKGILCFEMWVKEKEWDKGDVLDYFQVRNRADILETNQLMATLMLRKTNTSVKIIKQWCNISHSHLHLITDEPSKTSNEPGFVENRHDQSLFSIICKLNGIKAQYLMFEVEIGLPTQGHVNRNLHKPFLAVRNRTGISILPDVKGYGLFKKMKYMLISKVYEICTTIVFYSPKWVYRIYKKCNN